ncbi:MAG: ATP-binding cassette domain-containing protein, partial [Oceanidesulfovibrio sp.]
KCVLGEIRRLSDPRTTEEELMSVLGLFLLGQEYHDREVSSLSGGEKNRLVLASLFLARANFLILDEPTNHLDLESREALGKALESFTGTILLVAHDRWLLSRIPTQVWALEEGGMVVHEDGFAGYERARKAAEQQADGCEAPAAAPHAERKPSDTELSARKETREEAKQRKREEAARRNAMHKRLKPKKDAYAKTEAELEKVLEEMGAAEAALADPDVYADQARSAELLDAYTRTKDRSEALFEKLQTLETEIAELEGEYSEEAI